MASKPRSPFSQWWPALALLAVLVSCGLLLFSLYSGMGDADRRSALLSLWDTVSNLVLLGIVGGFVSLAYGRFEKRRAAARAIHDFRSDFLLKLQRSYRTTKTVRRALRASGLTVMRRDPLTSVGPVEAVAYREQMERLNEAQLDLEDLRLELKTFPDSFTKGERLLEIVRGMEDYLREILREYEIHWRRLEPGGGAQTSFDALERLHDFTGSFKNGAYRRTIVWGRNGAVGLIQGDLLPLSAATADG